MRSVVLLLTGFGLLAGGAALIALSVPGGALDVPGGLPLGIVAIAVGLAIKALGFLLGDSTSAEPRPGRGPQTLAGRSVERPRAGIPGGRATVRRATVSPLWSRRARRAPPPGASLGRPLDRLGRLDRPLDRLDRPRDKAS